MRHAALIGALCTVCVTACSDTGPNISGVDPLSIVRVTVSPSLDTLFVADTLRPTDRRQMSAAVIGRLGTPISGATVVWKSSDTTVAVVTEGGMVIPTGYGTTTISASASEVGKATIVVMPAARSVVIAPGSDTIFVEDPIAARDTVRLTATALDGKGEVITGVAFTWTSAGTNTATVNGAGVVLARTLGVTSISARSGEHVGTASVRVASAVKAIQVAAPATTVLALDTLQLAATALGYDDKPMGGRTFTWTSSNPTVATVNASGRAIFLSAGTTTFTAKSAFTTSTINVTALPRQFLSIDNGDDFACGYTNLGRGYCWGLGEAGQLASSPDSACFGEVGRVDERCALTPKRFAGPALEFTNVSAGGVNGCGITRDKLIYCWGDDTYGQIGNGKRGGGPQPTLATVAQVRFDSVTVGGRHACALSTTRQVYCWGADASGQLGDTVRIFSTTPIPIASPLAFSAISAGRSHTCGISGGTVYCWGADELGQLGRGSVGNPSDVPVAVVGVSSVSAISAGADHTCALTTGGSAMCWGDGSFGQAGAALVGSASGTAAIAGGPFVRISAGGDHTCALSNAGTAFCWGRDSWGQAGGTGQASPAAVTTGVAFKAITAGERHSCAITTDGDTYCWGSNVFGALGNELQAAFRSTPQKVALPR